MIRLSQRRERAKKNALKSHKDRVAEFNASLDRLRYVPLPLCFEGSLTFAAVTSTAVNITICRG